ncbi:MAG: dynactin subunit 2 [Rhizobiaceae bacterium]|nr:dynactin subunit 2 [Rhizobiaceae bacterium]
MQKLSSEDNMSTTTHLFNSTRHVQTGLKAWLDCSYWPCQNAQTCLGGPRGTCRKTGGWPLCSEEGGGRMKIAGQHKRWLGEDAPENETIAERRLRRYQRELENLEFETRLEQAQNKLGTAEINCPPSRRV